MASRDFPTARRDGPRRQAITREGAQQSYLTDAEAEASSTAIDAVVQVLGGRTQLRETLAIAGEAPEVEAILALLLDPRYDGFSLRRLCTLAGLTVIDLFAAYRTAMVAKAHLLAYRAITDGILPVVEDVMKRAAPFEVPCDGCGGQGKVLLEPEAEPTLCAACAGHGKVLQLPDLDRQKLALELAHLVQKSAGISIQQNTVVPQAPREGPGTLIELQQAVRTLLSGPRQPILEAEATPTPTEDPTDAG